MFTFLFTFSDVPIAMVTFGRSLNPKSIKEGADVYFECHVRSNPQFYNITWRNNVSIAIFLPNPKQTKTFFASVAFIIAFEMHRGVIVTFAV